MRNQDRIVDRPDPSPTGKMHRAHVRMVIEIADQKNARCRKRGNHARAMQPDLLTCYQRPPCSNQDCAGAVKRGIQGGEEAVIRHLFMMVAIIYECTTFSIIKAKSSGR